MFCVITCYCAFSSRTYVAFYDFVIVEVETSGYGSNISDYSQNVIVSNGNGLYQVILCAWPDFDTV